MKQKHKSLISSYLRFYPVSDSNETELHNSTVHNSFPHDFSFVSLLSLSLTHSLSVSIGTYLHIYEIHLCTTVRVCMSIIHIFIKVYNNNNVYCSGCVFFWKQTLSRKPWFNWIISADRFRTHICVLRNCRYEKLDYCYSWVLAHKLSMNNSSQPTTINYLAICSQHL